MFQRKRLVLHGALLALLLSASPVEGWAQAPARSGAIQGRISTRTSTPPGRVSLAPKFSPGQTFRYHIVFDTTTSVSHSGLATDPEGPAKEGITWDATMRFEVLPAAQGNGGVRLRLTYEKSSADIHSDTFDPNAAETQDQYRKLEGKTLEFTFNADEKLTAVNGLEGVLDSDTALQSARQWLTQFVAGPGAPAGGVIVGQKWTTNQPADALPIAGMVWRSESQYVRDEPCPAAPTSASDSSAVNGTAEAGTTAPGANPQPNEKCAVIVADLSLIQPKTVSDPTPEALLKSGVHTSGIWRGSARSQTYISLRTGLAVSITQSGNEAMDVTFVNTHFENLRYAGMIDSQSKITLEPTATAQ